ncbi:MAG: helix-turn-helix domain-containing protein [Phycisphaerales bacterium]
MTTDPAPALGRGLAMLELLHRQGACSLEQLAADSGWPKSSVLRLLQSLVVAGAASRDPQTLSYRALMRLVPVDSADRRLKRHCAASMAALGAACGHTVELHRYDATGLEMIDRQEPPPPDVMQAVVRAVARVGWRRPLDELDALTQVACALGDVPVKGASLWYWDKGKRREISADRARRVVTETRRRGGAVDLGVNEHGIRRYAAPLLDADGKLIAVLAIAQACPPHMTGADAAYAEAVRKTAGRLSSISL